MTSPASPAPSSPPVVPGAVHRLVVGERDAHGRALASLGRRPVRIPNALPGETLDVRLDHVGRHLAVGRVAKVVAPSPDRVDDACPLGATCPGCGLRTTSPAARLAWKRDRVVRALADAGLSAVEVAATEAAPREDGWRHKAYLTVRRTSDGVHLGLFAEGTHRLVRIEGCLAHASHVEATLDAVRRTLAEVNPSVYDERAKAGWLRAVAVRGAGNGRATLVTLVVADRGPEGAHALAGAIRRASRQVAGVVLNEHPEASNAPFGPRFQPLEGRADLDETSGPHTLRVSAGAFFQVNPAVGAAMADRIAAHAADARPGRALDLYGGVGATAIRLAAAGRPVTLVEAPGAAAADAQFNLRSVRGATVVEGRVEDVAATLPFATTSVIVVNPPRSGLQPAVIEALAAAPKARVIYASCDPASLARDLGKLVAQGRRIRGVTPFDMMPQTPHVEALAVVDPAD